MSSKPKVNLGQLAVIVLFIAAILFIAGKIPRLEAAWGGTILSLNGVVVQSASPYWQEMTMMGQVAMNGNNQYVWGHSGGSESVTGGVNTLVQPTYTSTQDLKIDFNMPVSFLRYNTQKESATLLKSKITDHPEKTVNWNCVVARSNQPGNCMLGQDFIIQGCQDIFNPALSPARQYDAGCKAIGGIPVTCNPGDTNSRKCVFVETYKVADVYSLGSPNKEWQVKLSMTTAGKSEQITLYDSTPSAAGNNLAAQWVGNYVTNTGIPEGSSAYMLSSLAGGTMQPTFKLISKVTLPSPSTQYQWQQLSSPTNGQAMSIEAFTNAINTENAKVDTVVNTAPPNGFAQAARPTSLSLTSVIIDCSSQPYFYPSLTFYTKAAWLGIGIPATKPSVLSLTTPTSLKSGEQGQVTAVIKNDGTQGAIDTKLTCNEIQITSGNPYRLTIAQGQTATAYWNVMGNSVDAKTITCSVVANDVNDPRIVSNTVTKTFTLEAIPQPKCGDGVCVPPTENNGNCPQDCVGGVTYCVDGTANGKCSSSKPFYCVNGNLVAQAATCGCATGLVAQPDGTCASAGTTPAGGLSPDLLTYGIIIVGLIVIVVAVLAQRGKK